MSIMRWEPFTSSDDVINRLLPGLFARWPKTGDIEWAPTADISETEKEYLIRAQLPAVKREDVKVTVDRGTLTLSGERKQRTDDKTEKMHRIESFQGSFMRRFELPDGVDQEAIRCESKDGELVVHIPKKAPTPPAARNVPIG